MDIHLTVSQRAGKRHILTVENKAVLLEGQETFQTTQTSTFVDHVDCTCNQTTYNQIAPIVGTMNAPALIADANAQPYQGRMNCYVENGSLKILAQA
ncbi:hypothetical protein [Emticicia fontis]